MKTKELNAKVFPYILEAINPEAYDIKLYDDRDKLQFLYDTFMKEYWKHQENYFKGNKYKAFEPWIMGLPSVFNIDFENWTILNIAKMWGSIPEDATEKQEDKILENWFRFIANKTFQLFKRYKIEL